MHPSEGKERTSEGKERLSEGLEEGKDRASEGKERASEGKEPRSKAKKRPSKRARTCTPEEERRHFLRKEVQNQLLIARTSLRFCEIMTGEGQETVRAAIDFAHKNSGLIDCSRSYTTDVFRLKEKHIELRKPGTLVSTIPQNEKTEAIVSPAFRSWCRSWSPAGYTRYQGWTASQERDWMEELLIIIIANGGLNGHNVDTWADLTSLFPNSVVPIEESILYRRCAALLAKHLNLGHVLFGKIIQKSFTGYRMPWILESIFWWWTPEQGKFPPYSMLEGPELDEDSKFHLEMAHALSDPDTTIYQNHVSPLMAAIYYWSPAAVYGLLESHQKIDLLAIDSEGCGVLDYALLRWKAGPTQVLFELQKQQRNLLEVALPVYENIANDLFPAVLAKIITGYLQPRKDWSWLWSTSTLTEVLHFYLPKRPKPPQLIT